MKKITNKCKQIYTQASTPNKHTKKPNEGPLPQKRLMGGLLEFLTQRPMTLSG